MFFEGNLELGEGDIRRGDISFTFHSRIDSKEKINLYAWFEARQYNELDFSVQTGFDFSDVIKMEFE